MKVKVLTNALSYDGAIYQQGQVLDMRDEVFAATMADPHVIVTEQGQQIKVYPLEEVKPEKPEPVKVAAKQ